MGPIQEVATREIRVRARTKVFRLTTALAVVIAVAAVVIASVADGGDDVRTVDFGVVGSSVDPFLDELTSLPPAVIEVDVVRFTSPEAAAAALEAGDIDVLFANGSTLVWQDEIDVDLLNLFDALWVQAANAARGISPPPPLEQLVVDPTDDDQESITIGVAMVGVIGSFMLIQTWGALVAMGVIEEKSTRVIEVLLSHVTPRQLIVGKVFGLGLLAMTQALIVVFGLFGALLVTDSVEVPSTTWRAVGFLVVTVGGGFTFYAVVFAAAGSLVSRTEDAQQVLIPVGLPLILGYVLGVSSINNPDATLAVVLSYVPFTIPTVMPLRLAGGGMSSWEVALAFAILFGSTVVVARLAGRLYHVTLLHAGTRITWRRAFAIVRGR